MNQQEDNEDAQDSPSTLHTQAALVVNKSRISKIWILPIVAVLIGLGMIYNDFSNQGVHIRLQFETAEGLVANKTVLKNRNVDIGLVQKISFSDDKSKIEVDIEVDKSMVSFLVEDSEFWVVKPRFGATGITGIGTLLSGAYIEVSPGQSRTAKFQFTGLETPPITSSNADGIHLKLMSRGTKPLKVGNPILHKGFEVGAVESKYYDDLEQEAHYDIFIHAPFHNLITQNTSFWNVSGLSISTTTQGIRLDMASIDALVAGGVEFGLVDGASAGVGVPQNHQFQLFDSKESIDEQRIYKYVEYVVLVEDSVGGLYKGAPVEYRGIRMGTVSEPYLEFWKVIDTAGVGKEDRIAVVLRLEPERLIKNGFISTEVFSGLIEDWIKQGMTASIETANIVTGSSKISLQPGGEPVKSVSFFGDYPLIPTGQSGFSDIVKKLDSVLGTLDSLPLQATLSNLNSLIDTTEETFKTTTMTIQHASLTLNKLEQSLEELQVTLRGLQPDSQGYRSVEQMIKKLEVSLDEVKPLIKEVTNQPSALVFGKPPTTDKQPQSAAKKEQ